MTRARRLAGHCRGHCRDLALFVGFALLLLRSLLHVGVGIYAANQQLQIPLLMRPAAPTLFPGDPFVDSLRYYASPLWWPISLLLRFVEVPTLMALLGVLSRVFSLWSIGRLAAALAPGSRTALLAGWCLAAL